MNSENRSAAQGAQVSKAVGILLLIVGLLCLVFSIVRYNSLLSQAMVASGRGDAQLSLAIAFGIISILPGVAFTFLEGGARDFLVDYSMPIGLRILAAYLFIIAAFGFFPESVPYAFWGPILAGVAGIFILIGGLFRKQGVGKLLLAICLIVLGIIGLTGIGGGLLLPVLLLVAGIFILIGK